MTTQNLWLLLAASLTLLQAQLCISQDEQDFPSIWSSLPAKSYHVLYQLVMDQSDELLMLEEWADYEQRLYRLDLITSSKSRTSYLFNGQSHEVLRYKPYTCERITSESKDFEILSKLFIGFPWSNEAAGSSFSEPIVAFGLGPLWLRASQDSSSVKHIQRISNRLLWDEDREFGNQFDEFQVSMKQDLIKEQLPYILRFYFPNGAQHFVDSIDWLLESSERIGDLRQYKLEASLKLIQLDYEAPQERVFQIPIGYGCQRRPELDHELQLDVGLSLLHEGLPNQISLEVTFSEPEDEALHSWTSQRYSMRMLRYSRVRQDEPAKSESVYVTMVQSRSPLNGGKLARLKRVWWAPDSSKGLASVYEIDQETGDCRMSHRDVRDQIILGYLDVDHTNEHHVGANLNPMVLSADQISFLFSDNTGYHLIEDGEPLGSNEFRERQYEKRVDHFQLTTDGSVVWAGPVSIVKRISSYAQLKKNDAAKLMGMNQKLSLLRDYRTTLTIFFYSENYDQLHYKIVVQLLGNHEVSYAYAHEQMDISACGRGAEQMVAVKYLLDNQRLAEKLKQRQESIASGLFLNLFDHPASSLSPLQLTNVQLSFDLFSMQLQLTVLDLPLTQLFQLELDRKLVVQEDSREARNALLETASSSGELCAQHCQHYNCMRFSFEPGKKLCQVELIPNGAGTKECEGCQLFTFLDRRSKTDREKQLFADSSQRPHLNADSLVEYFEQLVEAPEEVLTNPLELEVKLSPTWESLSLAKSETTKLRPNSIKHELESMTEYERELNDDSSVRQLAGRKLKLQFVLLMENARLNGDRFEGVATYEDCERFCELQDCRSFAYCGQDFSCDISYMHDEKYVKLVAKKAEPKMQCNIYSLDYMSKFEPYGRVLEPIEVRGSLEASTARVCANTCMDSQDFTCQGFFHCVLPAATNKQLSSDAHICYMVDKHVTSFASSQREHIFGSRPLGLREAQAAVKKVCDFYSRSYVAQFDKYFGKSIELTPDEKLEAGSSLVMSSGDDADAEDCARRCTELNCLAFDLCVADGRAKQTCKLVFKGLRSSQLRAAPKCTTFVLSDKSHFNSKKIKLLADGDSRRAPLKPNREAQVSVGSPDGKETILNEQLGKLMESESEMTFLRRLYDHRSAKLVRQFADSDHWLARLVSLALGLACGCLFVVLWNEAYARGFIDRARQQLSAGYGGRFV